MKNKKKTKKPKTHLKIQQIPSVKSITDLPDKTSKSLSKNVIKSSLSVGSKSRLSKVFLNSEQYLKKVASKNLDQKSSSSSSQLSITSVSTRKKDEGKSKSKVEILKTKSSVFSMPQRVQETLESKTEIIIKPKKGKKRKKEPPSTTKETEENVPLVYDYDEEIKRLKAEATGQAPVAPVVEEPPKEKKKKKGGKKKGGKKEKTKMTTQMIEKAKQEAELEAKRLEEEEKLRLKEELRLAIEKGKKEQTEQIARVEQLESSIISRNQLENINISIEEANKKNQEWEMYVKCPRLPNASKCENLTTYLHLWKQDIERTTIEKAISRTRDVLQILGELEHLLDTTRTTNSRTENWKWIKSLFREYQMKSLDVATYRLLRDIDKNLNRIDLETADYFLSDSNIVLCLWLRVSLPIPLPNPRRPLKPRIDINFKSIKMSAQFPVSIEGVDTAIRAMYLNYDHLSDCCRTFKEPQIPDQYELNLLNVCKIEWWNKLKHAFDNRDIPETAKKVPNIELKYGETIPSVPYKKLDPTSSEYVICLENYLYGKLKKKLETVSIDENIVNLRKYIILGGVYNLNLIKQPPQPQFFVTMELTLTSLFLPKQLEFVDFYEKYIPPVPSETGVRRTPEEIEEDLRKQEEELDKLICITITWPEHVIFLELPIVCFWTGESWTRENVYDLKHNEDKGQLSFRTGRFGTFALATYRYSNLPFQAWELRPETDGSVTLQITAAILMLEINVNKNGEIALTQLQNSPNNALQNQIGVRMTLNKLKRMLQEGGVDIFPSFDAQCYLEGGGVSVKQWPMERHLYHDIAQMALYFNFAWSRWNVTLGRRAIAFQMREYKITGMVRKQQNYKMVLVTPLNANLVDCSEISQIFTDETSDEKFYADLLHLMRGSFSIAIKNKVETTSKQMVYNLYLLLEAIKLFSFS